jgi:hypothetical protein
LETSIFLANPVNLSKLQKTWQLAKSQTPEKTVIFIQKIAENLGQESFQRC